MTDDSANDEYVQIDYVLGTAGHIDHGKSALVQALTGTDPDRLEEEKQRGITIELGFAQMRLPDGKTLSIVDVPGHERFVRQMIAGSSGIDGALLCIAADDGIMPQTKEHLAVLELLGIEDCIIAMTKTDLVDEEWIGLVKDEISEGLRGTAFESSRIIPVSAKSGAGLDVLSDAIEEMAERKRTKSQEGPVRMPIDRVFTIKGAGTVVTGTLWAGTINVDDVLEILPGKKTARARSIQVHSKPVTTARPGRRVAVNLQGVSVDEIHPGDFLATPDTLETTDRFDAYFSYIGFSDWRHPIESGTEVHISHGTREVIGRLLLFDGRERLDTGDEAYVQIRLNQTLPLSRGDRFIARSLSPVYVIGGGTVLDPHPRRRSTLKDGEDSFLQALHDDDDISAVRSLFKVAKAPLSLREIADNSGFDMDEVCAAIRELTSDGGIRVVGTEDRVLSKTGSSDPSGASVYGSQSDIVRFLSKLDSALVAFHAENPDAQGISKDALSRRIDKHIPEPVLDALIDEASVNGSIEISDGLISHTHAGKGSKEKLREASDRLLGLLEEAGQTPPTIDKLIAEAGLESAFALNALRELDKAGKVVKVSKDLYFLTPGLDEMTSKVRKRLEEGPATVAELRDAVGSTRKYMIPLMEYCDSHGITRRNGELRELAG